MSLTSLIDDASSYLLTVQLVLNSYLTTLYNILPTTLQTKLADVAFSLEPYATRENMQYGLRLVVIISTYLLFRPHIEALFRKATNTPDPRQAELESRLQFLRDLKDGKIQPNGGVEVVDGQVVLKPNRPAPAPAGEKKKGKGGGGKVVRLVVPGEGDAQSPAASTATATPAGSKSARRRKG